MAKKSATEVTLDVICREIKELKEGQKNLEKTSIEVKELFGYC
jgi:hypothetical protein